MKLIILSLTYTSFNNNPAYNCTYNLKFTPKRMWVQASIPSEVSIVTSYG